MVRLLAGNHGNPKGAVLEVERDGPSVVGWLRLWDEDKKNSHGYYLDKLEDAAGRRLSVRGSCEVNERVHLF